MNHSDEMVQFFNEVFNARKCESLCRKYNFIQRSTSKLKGEEFIKTMVLPSKGLSTDSLEGLCKRLRQFNNEADLSAQALSKRINNIYSSRLMKGVFGELLTKLHERITWSCPKLSKGMSAFSRVLIEDSSIMLLNESLEEKYKGTNRGGCSGKAQVKVDLIHDLSKGLLVDAQLFRGNEPDQSLAGRVLHFIKPGDLLIRDLGYFVIHIFSQIVQKGAYFLSRLMPRVHIYLNKDDENPLDLGSYLKDKKYSNCNMIQIKGFVGQDKVLSRLVIYRQPQQVTDQRLRDAYKNARGKTMSACKRLLLHFSIFITNAPEELLSVEMAGTVYRLRWEIELVFKRWKGQLEIDYLNGINANRIECLIWSRMCTVLIIELVTGYFKSMVNQKFDVELSEVKLIDYLLRGSAFCTALAKNKQESFFEEMEKDIPRMLLKNKRKRRTARERIFCQEAYYSMQPVDDQLVT